MNTPNVKRYISEYAVYAYCVEVDVVFVRLASVYEYVVFVCSLDLYINPELRTIMPRRNRNSPPVIYRLGFREYAPTNAMPNAMQEKIIKIERIMRRSPHDLLFVWFAMHPPLCNAEHLGNTIHEPDD
jgi:hypothetical protein